MSGGDERFPGYQLLLVSCVGERDGMAIELDHILGDGYGRVTAEVFRNDDTGRRTVTVFETDVPFEVIEWMITTAAAEL